MIVLFSPCTYIDLQNIPLTNAIFFWHGGAWSDKLQSYITASEISQRGEVALLFKSLFLKSPSEQ